MPEASMISNYKILGVLAQGGMGKIYRAIHPQSKKIIILKQLIAARSKRILSQRFKREADIMIAFSHPNIVRVFDFFKEGDSYFMAMEFINGVSLEKLIGKKKQIPHMPALLILSEACRGLKYAHDNGVIHRDIKPDNVLISNRGEVKLVDFGIARAPTDPGEELTKTGTIMGTPAYMSPEQLISAKNLDTRTDIYSLGVVFYQMVTGESPFENEFNAETIDKISRGDYVRPENLSPTIPGIFKRIIKRTMDHRINRRYGDLQELIDILSKYTNQYRDRNEINAELEKFLVASEMASEQTKKIHRSAVKIKFKGRLIEISKSLTIGRDNSNDIVIEDDTFISRNHATVEKSGDTVCVVDNQSHNGTFLNDQLILAGKPVKITAGDTIRVGKTKLSVV